MANQNIANVARENRFVKPVAEASRIAVPYLVVGSLWILVSDELLKFSSDLSFIIMLSNLKGWLYVLITSVLVFFLVRARSRQIWQFQKELEELNAQERKEREIQLEKNNRNMRVLLDSTKDAIFLIDRRGFIINLNTAAAGLLGKAVEEAIGSDIRELMSSEMQNQRGQVLWETFVTGKVGNFFGLRDNRWIETKYYPVYEPDGMVGAVATFSSDLTERVNAENEIYKSRQMLHEIIENAPVGIYWRDVQNKIIGINKVVTEITGMSMDDLASGKGDHFQTINLSDGKADDNVQILFSGEPKLNYEASIINCRGETRIIKLSKVPLYDKEGNPYALLGVADDITEQKRIIQELTQARQEAYDANKAKSAFLSMMSHEIRTPLNSIIGLAHIARRPDQIKQVPEYLENIYSSSQHLLGIINDILDISSIEAGKMAIIKEDFDFPSLIEETISIVQPKADEKRQNLDVYLFGDVSHRLIGDSIRLKQVMVNLVSNAVKFTPAMGSVAVRARLENNADYSMDFHFSVSDNGIGIPEDKQAKLFRSFEQLDNNRSREHGGTGLGLAISKRIIEMMGGTIGMQSKGGEGSNFFFSLPLYISTRKPQGKHMGFGELNLLVVDDDPETCKYLELLFSEQSVACEWVFSGEAALEQVILANNNNRPYNAVLVDWRMPGMNGMETAKEIRKVCGEIIIVIMITQYDLSEADKEIRDAGISLLLPKPILPSKLCGLLKDLTHTDKPLPIFFDMSEGVFTGKRILVVEDMEIIQIIIREMLSNTGAEIIAAMDGYQALQLYQEGNCFDAILMDVQLPGMDGYEVAAAIRQNEDPNAVGLPIIAMTANVYREDIDAALHAGMDDHIGKPVNFIDLYEKLKKHLFKHVTSEEHITLVVDDCCQ